MPPLADDLNIKSGENVQDDSKLPKKVFRDLLMEIGTANVWGSTMAGSIATGYVLLLGASEFEFGLLTAFGSIATISAPFFSFIVDRYTQKKKLTLLACLPVRLLQFAIALLPLLMFYKILPKPLALYLVITIIMSFFNVFANQAWFSWMGEIIPAKGRGYYFGRRNFVGSAVAMVFSVIAGLYLDGFQNKYFGFTSLFLFGSVFAMIAYYYFRQLPEAQNVIPSKEEFTFKTILRRMGEVYADKNYLKLVKFNAAWAFGITLIGTYQNMYLIKHLKMSYTLISSYLLIFSIMGLVTMAFWGKIIDKYGSKPVMVITANIIGIMPLLWVFISYAQWLLGVMYFISGACWSGFNLAGFSIMLKLSPKEKRASYLAFNTIVVGLAASFAPAAGGAILQFIGSYRLDLLLIQFNNYQLLFILGAFARFLPYFFLNKLQEPKEEQVQKVLLVVRSGIIEGVSTMLSYVMLPFSYVGNFAWQIIFGDKDEDGKDK
ncbi:MAG: MFS transporter [Candidatus Firestonebacteria bacterium]